MASYVAATTGTITFPWTTTATTTGSWTIGFPWTTTGTYTTTCTTTDVWGTWQEWHEPIMRTAEEEQRLHDEAQRAREAESRRRLAEMERVAQAQERALELLHEVVAEEDWVPGLELIQLRGSDGDLYRIETHRNTVHGNVVRVDEHGCVLGRACIAPRMYDRVERRQLALPTADGWLGQYLGLKFHAREFLARANWSETFRGCQHPEEPVLVAA